MRAAACGSMSFLERPFRYQSSTPATEVHCAYCRTTVYDGAYCSICYLNLRPSLSAMRSYGCFKFASVHLRKSIAK